MIERGVDGVIGLVDCIVLNRTEGRVRTLKTATRSKVKTYKRRAADDKASDRRLQATEMAGDCHTDAARAKSGICTGYSGSHALEHNHCMSVLNKFFTRHHADRAQYGA